MPPEEPEFLYVSVGTQVRVELKSDEGGEPLELTLVEDEQADYQAGFLGIGTPLALALLGRRAGETVEYRQGDLSSVKILEVRLAQVAPPPDTAARREDRLRSAVEQARRTDAMIFASSFSGKWGDYDPQGIEHWDPALPEPDEPESSAGDAEDDPEPKIS